MLNNMYFELPDHEAIMNVWWSSVMLKRVESAFFRKHPVTAAQFNVLMAITYAQSALTQKELSERLFVDQSNITGLVERMVQGGLIKRKPQESDRRCNVLTLTESGKALRSELEAAYLEIIHSLAAVFTPEELECLNRLMLKLQHQAADCTAKLQ